MNENAPDMSGTSQRSEPGPEPVYSIEDVVHITQTPRHLIAVYCRHGLIAPVAPPEQDGWWFDDEAIRELRHLQRWREELQLEVPALCVLWEMQREIERLRAEMRFLRKG